MFGEARKKGVGVWVWVQEWNFTDLAFPFALHFQLLEFELEEKEKGGRHGGREHNLEMTRVGRCSGEKGGLLHNTAQHSTAQPELNRPRDFATARQTKGVEARLGALIQQHFFWNFVEMYVKEHSIRETCIRAVSRSDEVTWACRHVPQLATCKWSRR